MNVVQLKFPSKPNPRNLRSYASQGSLELNTQENFLKEFLSQRDFYNNKMQIQRQLPTIEQLSDSERPLYFRELTPVQQKLEKRKNQLKNVSKIISTINKEKTMKTLSPKFSISLSGKKADASTNTFYPSGLPFSDITVHKEIKPIIKHKLSTSKDSVHLKVKAKNIKRMATQQTNAQNNNFFNILSPRKGVLKLISKEAIHNRQESLGPFNQDMSEPLWNLDQKMMEEDTKPHFLKYKWAGKFIKDKADKYQTESTMTETKNNFYGEFTLPQMAKTQKQNTFKPFNQPSNSDDWREDYFYNYVQDQKNQQK